MTIGICVGVSTGVCRRLLTKKILPARRTAAPVPPPTHHHKAPASFGCGFCGKVPFCPPPLPSFPVFPVLPVFPVFPVFPVLFPVLPVFPVFPVFPVLPVLFSIASTTLMRMGRASLPNCVGPLPSASKASKKYSMSPVTNSAGTVAANVWACGSGNMGNRKNDFIPTVRYSNVGSKISLASSIRALMVSGLPLMVLSSSSWIILGGSLSALAACTGNANDDKETMPAMHNRSIGR